MNHKDQIDFLGNFRNKNKYLFLMRAKVENEKYALKRAQEILDDYKKSGVYYTVNDL